MVSSLGVFRSGAWIHAARKANRRNGDGETLTAVRAPLSRSEEAAWATLLQNRRVQEANRLKSEFLSNMSHELRTPLNAIIGFAELMFDGHVEPGSPEQKEFLGDILASGRHLLQMINDVLDLVKVEAGRLELHPVPVDPVTLVSEVCALLRGTLAAKNLDLRADVDPTLAGVELDPGRFKQVLYNYLSNAAKFTPPGGKINVRVAREYHDETLRIEVADTGIGIAASDLGDLFVEFQQLDVGAAKRHAGAGLGLVLTKRVVEAQGGTVGVRSQLGKGSTFFATLPRRAPARPGGRPALHSLELVSASRDESPCVLVVDGDRRENTLVATALVDAGYRVDTATTGAEALDLCERNSYDALTLSLALPDMSALELLSVSRAAGRNRGAVTILLAAADQVAEVGPLVNDVLDRPFNAEELLISLRSAGVRPDEPGGVLVVDDDPAALRLMEAALARSGYGAVCRSNGSSGIEAALRLDPLAVVVDLVMPGMDGFEFIERLRALPKHRHTPLFVWSTKDLTPEERRHLRANAQGVITKTGVGASHLMAELRAVLPPPGVAAPGDDVSGRGTLR
jgi:signal transduction histidine kinase/DNA-binding response OmpR family regulator